MKSTRQVVLLTVALLLAAPFIVVGFGLPLGLLSIGLDQLPVWVKPLAVAVVVILMIRWMFGLSILPKIGKR